MAKTVTDANGGCVNIATEHSYLSHQPLYSLGNERKLGRDSRVSEDSQKVMMK